MNILILMYVLFHRFDKVFSDDAAQSKIYEDVKSLVPNVLNGQNATIFGYGPTGAGTLSLKPLEWYH